MFNGYNETPNFYNQGLFDNCNHSGLLSGEMSKHTSAPPWEYPPQPYNNLPCYTGQQHLSHRQLPLIHNQVVSHLEKKESALHGTNSTHNYSSNNAHQPVVKPTALINCQANCNACCSHSGRVPHHWNPSSESVRYLDHASLSKELPRYPHGVSNFPTEDARFVGDFSSTFDKLPLFPRDAVENLSHAGVTGVANKKEFTSSLLHGSHQNPDIEPVKKEKCTKCRGICRSNCKQSKQHSTVKLPNQDQLHASRENVVRYSGHHSLNSTTWPIPSQAQSGMWFQNAQPPFWMSHNDVQMPGSDSFGYWANNEDLSPNISLHHGRSGMQNASRYPVHTGNQESVTVPEAEQNKYKAMASYQDSYKHKCAEVKANGEILRKELQEPLQNNKVSKQRLQTARSLDMSREFSGRNCDLSSSSQVQDISKTSVFESSVESPYAGGDDVSKLYGGTNSSNSIRTSTTNFNSYPFVNVSNNYNMGLPQSLSQFSSHISYNQAKLERGSSFGNNLQYSNATSVGSFISPQIENNHSSSYIPAIAKTTATNHQTVPNSCIQYRPSKENSVEFGVSQQSNTHPVSDVIKYNFANSGNEPAYSMLQSCNKMSENVACGKTMQMIPVPDSCAEKVGSKTNPYYYSNVPHSTNNTYTSVGRNVQMRPPPFRFGSVDSRKENASCNMFCDSAPDNRSTSNFRYENSHVQNSSNVNISPSANVSDNSPVQVDSPFVTHSPAGVSRPIKKRRPRLKGATKSEQLHKGPILDVRQYLATWDEESDDVTTMHRLSDVLSSGNTSDGLVVLNSTDGRAPDGGLELVPIYNDLADDGSESSSMHSENAQSCQHTSIENLTEGVELQKPNSSTVNCNEQTDSVMNNGKHNDVVVEGNMNEKNVGSVAEQQISPSHPRLQPQPLDHLPSVSPGDSQQGMNLPTQAHKFSDLENGYLPINEPHDLHTECCKNEFLNETKSPVPASSAQSFDTATALLSDDHETLSSCDLVPDLHITEVVPVSRDVTSAMQDTLPVGALCAEPVKSSQHEESCSSAIVVKSDPFSGNPKISPNGNQPGVSDTSCKDGNNLQQADTLEHNTVNSEGTVGKDTDKGYPSAKQLDVIQLYSGRNDNTHATDCNNPDAAVLSCQILSGEAVLASTIPDDNLKQPEVDGEVFINSDIQFPDLSYTNSDSSVDADMQTSKDIFSEDVALSPRLTNDSYSEKHSDSSFIRSFVNEIASNIPNFISHPTGDQGSSCADGQGCSDQKVDENNPEKALSEYNITSGATMLSQCSKSENCNKEIGEKKELQGQAQCEPFTKSQKCGTVIGNISYHMLDYNGGCSSYSSTVEMKQSSKESLRCKKNIRLKKSQILNSGNNRVVKSHFAMRKIKLRTREAKKCSSNKSLKTENFKYLMKKKCKQSVKINKNKPWLLPTHDKNEVFGVIQSKVAGSDNEINELESSVTELQNCGKGDSKLEHDTENDTAFLASNKDINSYDLRLEVNSNKCEETEIAINLVLESAKQEDFTDISSKYSQKHVPQPEAVCCNPSKDNICEGRRSTDKYESLTLLKSTLCLDDDSHRPHEGGNKRDEEAVDLRVSKPDKAASSDVNIYCFNEADEGAIFCSNEIGQKTTVCRKSSIFSFSEWNITPNNVPSDVKKGHESSHCKPHALARDVHAQWQNFEMRNQSTTYFQKHKPVERGYDTGTGLIFNSTESRIAPEYLTSNPPVQAEALDLCKHTCNEKTSKCDGEKEPVMNNCITTSSHHLEQLRPQGDRSDCSASVKDIIINNEETGLNYKSSPFKFKDGCSAIVMHDPESGDQHSGLENKDLNDASEVNNMTTSFSGNDYIRKTLSAVDCTHNVTENKSLIHHDCKTSKGLKLSEPSFYSIDETEKYSVIKCESSRQSASTRNCVYRADTSVLQNVQYLEGNPQTQENELEDNVNDQDIHKAQELDGDCNRKMTTNINGEGSNQSELEDGNNGHRSDVLEPLTSVQGQGVSELQQEVDDSYETEMMTTTLSGKDCKQLTSTNDGQHSLSRDIESENVSGLQQSKSAHVTKVNPSTTEGSKESDLCNENVCRRESFIGLHVNIQNEENEPRMVDNSQTNETESVKVDNSMCRTETCMPENIQDEVTTCTSSACKYLDLEGSQQIDEKLNMQEKSCIIETEYVGNHSEKAGSFSNLNILDVRSRSGNIYTECDGQQQADRQCKEGSIMLKNHDSQQFKAQSNDSYEMEICTPPSIQNQYDSKPQNEENNHKMEMPVSSTKGSELPCSPDNTSCKTELPMLEKAENNEVVTVERSFVSEVEMCAGGRKSEKFMSEGVNLCERENSTFRDFLDESDEPQQQCQEICSKSDTTSIYTQDTKSPDFVCSGPEDVQGQAVALQVPDGEDKSEECVVPNGNDSEQSERAVDNLHGHELCMPVDFEDNDVEVHEQGCSLGIETIPTNSCVRKQLEGAQVTHAVTNCQDHYNGKPQQSDFTLRSAVSRFGNDDEQSVSTNDSSCSIKTSHVNIQGKEVGELQPSDCTSKTEISMPMKLSNSRLVEPENSNLSVQETNLPQSVEVNGNVGLPENSLHDQASDRSDIEIKAVSRKVAEFVSDHDSQNCQNSFVDVVKNTGLVDSCICKGNSVLNESRDKSGSSLDCVGNDNTPNGNVMESLETIVPYNRKNKYSDNGKVVSEELRVETVQEQNVLSGDIAPLLERNCNVTSTCEYSRNTMEHESSFGGQFSETTNLSTENIGSAVLNEVSMQPNENLEEVAHTASNGDMSGACVPDLLLSSCKNNKKSKQEGSRPISNLQRIPDRGANVENCNVVSGNFESKELVNFGSVENNKVHLLSGGDPAGDIIDINTGDDQNDHLANDKSVKTQKLADDKVNLNQIFEKESTRSLESYEIVEVIQKTPLSEILNDKIVPNNAVEPVNSKQSTCYPESMPAKVSASPFKDAKVLENRTVILFKSPVRLPQAEFGEPNILCSESEQGRDGNTVNSDNRENEMTSNCGKQISAVCANLGSTEGNNELSSCQTCSIEGTMDDSSEAVCVKYTVSELKEQSSDCVNRVDRIIAADTEMQMELQNSACLEQHTIDSKHITTDPGVQRCANELSEEFEQPKAFDCEPVEKVNISSPCGSNSDKRKYANVVCSTHKKSVDEYDEDKAVPAALLCNDELIEGQLIIIQNSCNDITNSINISAESIGVNSVCLENLEHVNNEENNTWPVIVESDEATQIFIAVAEGSANEAENKMPSLEVEPPCVKSPEMPHLEAMTKHYENDSNDQDLEMPILDASTSVSTDVVKDTTEMPKLESAIMSPGVEVKTCVHIAVSEFCHCQVVHTEESEAFDLQRNGNEMVCEMSGSMADMQGVCLLQVDNPPSLKDDGLTSREVENIFPILSSENIQQPFHDATHIIPGDSVSNWPYLEEEVLSELAPYAETTVPLSEAPSDNTVVPSFSSMSFSPSSSLNNSRRKISVVRNKYRAKGWSKKKILYYYNSDTHKAVFRKKGSLYWSRICARSKVDKSKSFKANISKRCKISKGWPYFGGRSPARWLQYKTKGNYSKSGNDVLIEKGDSHTKIEVRLAQKCERVGGVKTWHVVGSSEMNNDHSWPVIEENNNVMTTSNGKSEDKVPVVLVKRLVLKKSVSSNDGEGTQEYTVKSSDNDDISSATNNENSSGETCDVNHETCMCQEKVVETTLPNRLMHDNLVSSKEYSVDMEPTNSSYQVDLTSLTCTVCDNAPTASSQEYCKRHSPKLLADSSEHVSVEEHQGNNSAHHIPRVIIKRTGPGSAKYQSFLRTSPGSSQWQPVVQLLRSKVLDNLARNVLEVGSIKKVISLSNFRLVLGKRSNAASESVVESGSKQVEAILEASQAFGEDMVKGGESVCMIPDAEKEKTGKNASSCKYVVLENNTKDTRLTFQRQKSESESEEQSEHTDEQFNNDSVLLPSDMTNSKAKEVLSYTEISDSKHPTNRNRDRKCKGVFTYMESSSEDSQENIEMMYPMVRTNRKRLLENEDDSQICSEICNKRPFIFGEIEASSADTGKRKHSFAESAESTRKKAYVSRHNSSSSADDACGFGCSVSGMEDSTRLNSKEKSLHRPRSLRCKNVVAVSHGESAPDACRACSYIFVDEADKADHVKQHPYHCQRCHLAFQSKMDFRNHLSTMHPRTKEQHHCLLCERTFPTAARHKVHLTGRQHRYLEMTQRRTIHTLFKLFTNEFCPALPAPTREELAGLSWFPSEPGTIHFYHQATPLQLAVQDLMWRRRQLNGSGSESTLDGPQGR